MADFAFDFNLTGFIWGEKRRTIWDGIDLFVVVSNCQQIWWTLLIISLWLQVSIPAWFTVDTRLGSLSVHLDTPQCFSAEMYSADLQIAGKPEDDKVKVLLVFIPLSNSHVSINGLVLFYFSWISLIILYLDP